ncbi:MAG: hypothetical protein JSV51_01625, partial [Candidatus Bathyarchaeota archaeon]
SDARETCEKLADEGNKELEKGKAVRKAKATLKLSGYFLKQLDKIVFPDGSSYAELDDLHKDLEKMFSGISRERNAWFPRISPLFIIARKRADFAFSRMAGSISELRNFLSDSYAKVKVVEALFVQSEEMSRLLEGLSEYEDRKARIEARMQSFQKELEKSKQNIESTKGSTELDDLAKTSESIQQLRKQVHHDLRMLRKPLLKFANLTRGPKYALTSEEVEKLAQYLEDPFIALATEKPDYPLLKSILRKIKRAMDEGNLKLKSSRLRKGRDQIDLILNENSLNSLYLRCKQTFSSSQQMISSEETQAAQRKLKQLQTKAKELQRRRGATTTRLNALEKKHEQLLERVRAQKKQIEEMTYELLNQHIQLKF